VLVVVAMLFVLLFACVGCDSDVVGVAVVCGIIAVDVAVHVVTVVVVGIGDVVCAVGCDCVGGVVGAFRVAVVVIITIAVDCGVAAIGIAIHVVDVGCVVMYGVRYVADVVGVASVAGTRVGGVVIIGGCVAGVVGIGVFSIGGIGVGINDGVVVCGGIVGVAGVVGMDGGAVVGIDDVGCWCHCCWLALCCVARL